MFEKQIKVKKIHKKGAKVKGKILEYGVILGDDGRKYSFSYDDIMNLSQKGRQKLENLGVDFIPNDESATEIYLLIKENSRTESEIQKAEFKNAESNTQNSQPKSQNAQSYTENSKITRRKTIDKNAQNNSQNANEFSNKAQNENSQNFQTSNSNANFQNLNQNSQKTQLDSIKRKAYIMLVCYALFFLIVPFIVAFVLNIMVVLELQRAAQSRTLFKNFIISIVLPIVIFLLLVVFLVLFALDFSDVMDIDGFLEKLDSGGFNILLGMIIVLPAYYFYYLYSKESAHITNQPYFIYSFWTSLAFALMSEISYVLSAIFFIASVIFYAMAWIKFKEIVVKEK